MKPEKRDMVQKYIHNIVVIIAPEAIFNLIIKKGMNVV